MKDEIKKVLEIVNAVNAFAESITTNNVSIQDLRVISQLNPKIGENITTLSGWVSNNHSIEPTPVVITEQHSDEVYTTDDEPWIEIDPESEWALDKPDNLMVSANGKFYDLTTERELIPRFVDGELRIDMPDDNIKRAAVIVAKSFKLWSNDGNNSLIAYIDGDRRNINISNLYWKKRSDYTPISAWNLLIEDICRRIIEYKCDLNKIMLAYTDSSPSVSKDLVVSIIKKDRHSDISDRFFYFDGDNEIVPVKDIITDQSEASLVDTSMAVGGYDIGQFLITTGDIVIAESLLKDKIKTNDNLSDYEKEILVFSAIKKIGGNRMPSTMVINKMIKEMYGVTMTISAIDELKTKVDSISSTYEIYGG